MENPRKRLRTERKLSRLGENALLFIKDCESTLVFRIPAQQIPIVPPAAVPEPDLVGIGVLSLSSLRIGLVSLALAMNISRHRTPPTIPFARWYLQPEAKDSLKLQLVNKR